MLSEIRICPPVVYDSIRPVRLTCVPTAAYFIRRFEPMLPTITSPVWTPIPISTSGNPRSRLRAFTPSIASCIARAQATARSASVIEQSDSSSMTGVVTWRRISANAPTSA